MIAIGCDHGGLDIKNAVIEYLKKNGIEYKDYGCYTSESVDYPKYAYKVATAVANKEAELGILCCGTGIGISIAANKVKGIRAAVVSNEFCAETASGGAQNRQPENDQSAKGGGATGQQQPTQHYYHPAGQSAGDRCANL